ncbi:chloride channel protein [Eubacterium sp. OM08-24]|uniref:chloride channel protein n=1 Tax=Eubacterium sp. OM08-24 TaxID=2292352 RepID=UPI000E4436AB|nr:chloride channel protein [Eubacterium sp. OM08-24]RGM22197.1 chloride channel protein [Eubacterium sp. OM08-24]
MKRKFVDLKVILVSLCCAVVMGIISFVFLKMLGLSSVFREFFPYCIWFLPLSGMLTAFVYKRYGGESSKGNNLIIQSANEGVKVPKRLAFLTFIFTLLTHLSGGSAGREGTAVQIGGTLTSNVADKLGFKNEDRKIIILSGLSAAFGSVFGTPLAGAFFGMEVCCIGQLSVSAVIPCFLSSYLANAVTLLLGATHEVHKISAIPSLDIKSVLVFISASILFGLIGKLFALGVKYLKLLYAKIFKNTVLSALIGSVIVVLLIVLLNLNEYEGLSTWQQTTAFEGNANWYDMPVKFILTTLTLGAGFQGGEVTPLFDIGASFGGWYANMFGIEPSFLAAIGLICVFGSAANTPITTIMLGIELFGAEAVPYFVFASLISFIASGKSGIYSAQKRKLSKNIFTKVKQDDFSE